MSNENDVKNAKEVTEQKKEHVELDRTLDLLAEDRLRRQAKEARNRQDKIDDMNLELKTMQQFGMMRDAEIRQQEIILEEMRKIEDLQKNISNMKQKGITEGQELLKLEDQLATAVSKFNEEYKEVDLTVENLNKKLDEQDDLVDNLKENVSEYDDILGGIASKIGLGNSKLLKTVQGWTNIGKKIASSKEEQEKFAKAAKQMFSVRNIAASLLESYIGLALEIDNAGAKMAAATGAGTKFQGVLSDIKLEGYEMGRSIENTSQALLAFNDNLIGMTDMSFESVKQLGAMGADFQRLGVSGQEFTQTLNIMTKSMGVSNKRAAELTQELAMIGTNIGLSSQRMIKDFSAASSVLAAQGTKSIKIFKNLAAAARNSGVEMSELLGIAQKFDTFADAAETTAKLNAVLGSQMSATRMLMMDEDKRIEQIIKSVQASGQQFSQMDKFTQKAIANAAGISDMAKANQIFGMSLGAYRRSQKEINKQADVQQKFADAIKATIPLQEKFANLIQSIVNNKEFMGFLNGAISGIETVVSVLTMLNKVTGGYLPVVIMLGGAIQILGAFLAPFGAALFGVAKGILAMGKSADEVDDKIPNISRNVSVSIQMIGTAAGKAAFGLFMISVAAIAVGTGIYIAAMGVVELVKAFGGLGDAAMPAAIGLVAFSLAIYGIVAALASLSGASIALGPGLAVLGVLAVVMIGISMAASTIADSLERMGDSITASITALTTGLTNASLIADVIRKGAQALEDIPNSAEFQATMHSMATIASGGRYIAETATATANASMAPMANYDPSVSITNSFGNLKLVLADNTQLDAYILDVADQQKR
tara:strand:- start:5909 stop:8380 length:2472 start_codon:yes stop_codon:yes gene_type:complete